MSSTSGTLQPSSNFVRRSQDMAYGLNWNHQLNFNMAWYSFFMTNGRMTRAFWKMYECILQVQQDKQKRVFTDRKTKALDEPRLGEFGRHAENFNSLFGTGPSLDGKFSFLDLKTREKPDPLKNRVVISKMVKFVEAWKRYNSTYIELKAGFQYAEKIPNDFGFPVEEYYPMIDREMGDNPKNFWTNVIPFSVWEEQSVKCLRELMPITKQLETMMAAYLHREGLDYQKAAAEMAPPLDYSSGNSDAGEGEEAEGQE